MKKIISIAIAVAALSATPALAEPPCKVGAKTTGKLDELLDKNALAEIKSNKGSQEKAFSNVTDILKGDECVGFLLNKSKRKKLAAVILQEKGASAKTKSSMIIGKFLSAN